MSRGILDIVGLAVTLAFAVPVGYAGGSMLLNGELLFGVALLVVAVVMVLIEEYVVSPGDLPSVVAQKATGVAVADLDEEEPD